MVNDTGKKILLIEDDSLITEVLTKNLSKAGFQVSRAGDGVEALSKLTQFVPDLILLDIILPRMDGFEVLARIKADPATSSIPVLILSNLGSTEDFQRGSALGAADYMVKASTTPEEIIARIQKLLGVLARSAPAK